MAYEYGPVTTDADLAQLPRLLSHAFAFPIEQSAPWLERAGYDNLRIVRASGGGGGGGAGGSGGRVTR